MIVIKATQGGQRTYGDTANLNYWSKTMGNTTSPDYRTAIAEKFDDAYGDADHYSLEADTDGHSYFGSIWDNRQPALHVELTLDHI